MNLLARHHCFHLADAFIQSVIDGWFKPDLDLHHGPVFPTHRLFRGGAPQVKHRPPHIEFFFFTLLRTRSVLVQLHFLSLRVCHSGVSHTNAHTAPPLRAHHVCLPCHENEIILIGLIGAEKTAGESFRKVGISLHNKKCYKKYKISIQCCQCINVGVPTQPLANKRFPESYVVASFR